MYLQNIKRITAGVCLAVMLFVSGAAFGNPYYVSSAGDDSNDGLSETTPIKSLAKANTLISSGVTILFRRGDVFRGQLDVSNTKTGVSFDAYGSGDNPAIAGSIEITGWTLHQGSIYAADVSGIIGSNPPVHLFVNGRLMTIARHPNADAPNSGWLQVGTSTDKKTFTDPALAGKPDGYWNGATVRIRTFSWLFEVRTAVDYKTDGTLTLNKDLTQTLAAAIQPGWGYYLDNKLDILDQENEWYFDPAAKKIYLWAPGGADPNTMTVEAAVYSTGAKLFYSDDARIENITFRHQTADGININQCDRTAIRNCRFEYCVQKGILTWNAPDLIIENNVFDHNLDYAVMLNGSIPAGNTQIVGNTIRNTAIIPGYGGDGSKLGGDGETHSIAIRIYGTPGVQIRNNTIENTGYAAIFLEGGGHIVEKNIIRKSQLTLDDGGAIYIKSDNNQIRYNYIAESWGNRDASSGTNKGSYFRQMGMGIFFWPKRSGNIIEHNTVADNTDFGVYPDRAIETVIRSNVFYNNRYQLYLKGQIEDVTEDKYRNIIEGNTFYSLSPNQYCLRVDDAVDLGTFHRNYYCNPTGGVVIREDNSKAGVPVYSLEHWQEQHPDRDQDSRKCSAESDEYVISDAGDNRIVNSYFTNNITGWSESGDGTISHDPAKALMDGGSLKNTFSGTADSKIFPNKFTLEQNKFYRLKFSAAANTYGNLRVIFYNEDIGGAWVEYLERFFALSPARKDMSFVFQWLFANSGSKPWFITTSRDPSEYWLDNVTLEPVQAVRIDPKTTSVLFTNPSDADKTVDLGTQRYLDPDGNTVIGSILLGPFESKILLPDNITLKDALNNLQVLSGISVSGVDADKNGVVEIRDVILILQKTAGVK